MSREWTIEVEDRGRGDWLAYHIYDHGRQRKGEVWIKWTCSAGLAEIMKDHERQARLAASYGPFSQAKN